MAVDGAVTIRNYQDQVEAKCERWIKFDRAELARYSIRVAKLLVYQTIAQITEAVREGEVALKQETCYKASQVTKINLAPYISSHL